MSLHFDPSDPFVDTLGSVADLATSQWKDCKKLKGPFRSGRLTTLLGAAVVGIRSWETHLPKLHILSKYLVKMEMHQCAALRIVGLPLMDQLGERVSTAARSLLMRNIHGAGALPGKGWSPGCEGRSQRGLGHDEGRPDRLVAKNASCETWARGVPEPSPGSCATASSKDLFGNRSSITQNLSVVHNGLRRFMISERDEVVCSVGDVAKAALPGGSLIHPGAYTRKNEHCTFRTHIDTSATSVSKNL